MLCPWRCLAAPKPIVLPFLPKLWTSVRVNQYTLRRRPVTNRRAGPERESALDQLASSLGSSLNSYLACGRRSLGVRELARLWRDVACFRRASRVATARSRCRGFFRLVASGGQPPHSSSPTPRPRTPWTLGTAAK